MRVQFGCCLALALAVCGAQASERADFTTGEGTNGWTISAAEYVSPTYAGAVDRISLSYSGTAAGSATVSALAQGGGESPVATLSAAANVATFDFPETTDFRAFRILATRHFSPRRQMLSRRLLRRIRLRSRGIPWQMRRGIGFRSGRTRLSVHRAEQRFGLTISQGRSQRLARVPAH